MMASTRKGAVGVLLYPLVLATDGWEFLAGLELRAGLAICSYRNIFVVF
jgi:hypothetical protein